MRIHFLPNKSKDAVATALKIHPFVASNLIQATKIYNPKKIAINIAVLHEYDLKSKGVGNTGAFSQSDLMKEMVYRLLY
jgi:DNA polymerase-3 subunit delta